MSTILGLFQSTLSVRRATDPAAHVTAVKPISIHALREESDGNLTADQAVDQLFQSTLSVRRAT